MNITQFRIDLDMEMVPCEGNNIIGMMVLESKQELTELKRKL